MKDAKRRAWILAVGALVTLFWLVVCPKYIVEGPERHTYLAGSINALQGAHEESRRHPEPTYFWGGVAIIFIGLMACYQFLILNDMQTAEAKVKSAAESAGEKAGTGPNE